MKDLDSHKRAPNLRKTISEKKALSRLYLEFYERYKHIVEETPRDGIAVEIGSGAGFVKEVVPKTITTDILPYETVELAMDATKLPFKDKSVSSFYLLNTLHHIPDAYAFFSEVSRCLKPGGKMLIIDQYHGWFSKFILKYLHHEAYDPTAESWDFETSGPLSGANGALCWIIFYRDRSLFEKLYPSLTILRLSPHTPFRYWLSGGLKKWSLLPEALFDFATKIDHRISKYFPQLSSFVDVELEKS